MQKNQLFMQKPLTLHIAVLLVFTDRILHIVSCGGISCLSQFTSLHYEELYQCENVFFSGKKNAMEIISA